MKHIKVLLITAALSVLMAVNVFASVEETDAVLDDLKNTYKVGANEMEILASADNNLSSQAKEIMDSIIDERGEALFKRISDKEIKYITKKYNEAQRAENEANFAYNSLDFSVELYKVNDEALPCVVGDLLYYLWNMVEYDAVVDDTNYAVRQVNAFNECVLMDVAKKAEADKDNYIGNEAFFALLTQ